jgi:uncharacterized protein YcnI
MKMIKGKAGNKWLRIFPLLCVVASMLFAASASAHVVVYPKETAQGAYEVFTVRVPTEKPAPTVKVEVKLQTEAVQVSRVEPKPGWTYTLAKDASGGINGITWTATGDGLAATEFGDFKMQGKVADEATSITWKAYQTYKDGSVVEWTGASGSDSPASVTKVVSATAGGNGGAAGTSMSLYLAAGALVISLISLVLAWVRR